MADLYDALRLYSTPVGVGSMSPASPRAVSKYRKHICRPWRSAQRHAGADSDQLTDAYDALPGIRHSGCLQVVIPSLLLLRSFCRRCPAQGNNSTPSVARVGQGLSAGVLIVSTVVVTYSHG
jgi:hypothetical protein